MAARNFYRSILTPTSLVLSHRCPCLLEIQWRGSVVEPTLKRRLHLVSLGRLMLPRFSLQLEFLHQRLCDREENTKNSLVISVMSRILGTIRLSDYIFDKASRKGRRDDTVATKCMSWRRFRRGVNRNAARRMKRSGN